MDFDKIRKSINDDDKWCYHQKIIPPAKLEGLPPAKLEGLPQSYGKHFGHNAVNSKKIARKKQSKRDKRK